MSLHLKLVSGNEEELSAVMKLSTNMESEGKGEESKIEV
jgi:hypothetical protein